LSLKAVSPSWDPDFATSRMHGERAQFEYMMQVVPFCKQKRTALDIGAHIGLWSRNLAPRFTSVVAFEPVKENAECFRQNTNTLSNVSLFELAVGDQRATVELELPPHGANSGMHHVAKVVDAESSLFAAQMVAIDALAIKDIDLIKIDVEGFEGRVIRGAIETIQRDRPVIAYEDNGLGAKYYGVDWVNPEFILRALNYRLRLNWRKDKVWIPK
jgi:FkbM family methyltransferase